MAMSRLIMLVGSIACASAMQLTPDNWAEQTAGKNVFILFMAPWCEHSKAMKPTWDRMMAAFEGSDEVLAAYVNCIAEGNKALCEEHGVTGFPTIKWGNPAGLEDYYGGAKGGGRDYGALKKFANDNLKAMCSPAHIDFCDAKNKAKIEELMKMPMADLEAAVEKLSGEFKEAQTVFEEEATKLQAKMEEAQNKKTAGLLAINDVILMRAVRGDENPRAGLIEKKV